MKRKQSENINVLAFFKLRIFITKLQHTFSVDIMTKQRHEKRQVHHYFC